jgi:hypothetical protein
MNKIIKEKDKDLKKNTAKRVAKVKKEFCNAPLVKLHWLSYFQILTDMME